MRDDGLRFNEALFWSKVEKTETCWNWTACADGFGYGQLSVRIGGKWRRVRAHRVSYMKNTGRTDTDGLCVLHKCDNPRCVRPEHLFLGTRDENMKDMAKKGRHVSYWGIRDECSNGHKWTEANTYMAKPKNRPPYRACRTCCRLKMRRLSLKKKQEKLNGHDRFG